MTNGWWGVAVAVGAVLLMAAPVHGQGLTLAEALRRAESDGYANRMAAGATAAQSARQLEALQGVLPAMRVEGGFARTTDPIGAFGVALRQRRIGPADFDPARLNHPDAVSNYMGAVVLEQPVFNADALLGRAAAGRAAAAARGAETWTRVETRVNVIRAYYGAVLAREQVATLESALRAAREHVRRAESLVANGLATRSDALLASVQAGELEAQLIEARGRADLAGSQLAVLLGSPGGEALVLPARLPGAAAIRELPVGVAPVLEERGDVTAAQHARSAATLDVRRAQSQALPRVNAMARYDWNSAARPFGGDENWSVGVMVTWSPFTSAAQLADMQATRGRAVSAQAGAEAALAQARLEAERSGTDWNVAVERLRIAGIAVEQSAEAHRIVSRKYDGGLATVVELLGAAAVETESALKDSHARYHAIATAADRLRALGHDPAVLSLLDGM
ncbi:MAG TPA: TolC family protein, partial [Longimicrobiales bacterium]|nr:TolC family protein [Longimicrobiales bacterium]